MNSGYCYFYSLCSREPWTIDGKIFIHKCQLKETVKQDDRQHSMTKLTKTKGKFESSKFICLNGWLRIKKRVN